MAISTIGSNSLNQTSDLTINGVTVGKGGGSEAGSTTVGGSSLGGNSTNTGIDNSAFGFGTLYVNTSGSSNSAFGRGAMRYNTTGGSNAAFGYQALNNNTTANYSTAVGYQAGYAQTTGGSYAGYSTYLGHTAGLAATGAANTLIGQQAGSTITSGEKNTLIGRYNGNQNGLDIRTSSNYIVLSDGDGNPRLVIDSGGSIIGGAAVSTSGWGASGINIKTANGAGQQCYTGWNTATSGPSYYAYYGVGTSFTATGSITCTNGSNCLFNSISDYRLKENIVDAGSGLDKITNIKIRSFDWISTKENVDFGVVAQELYEVAPEAVTKGIDHEDGSMDKAWQVDTSVLVPSMIKAIQELKTIVDAQAAEIAELKAKVA